MINKKLVNVLYISYDGMTDPLGQSQVLPYLIKLAESGYKITLLSCEKPERFINGKSIIEDLLINTSISWKPIFYTKKPPVLSTVYDYYKLKSKAHSLHKTEKYDIVHCRSYLPSMIGLVFKKKYGVKFIFDMRGFWADERVDGGLWNLRNPLYKSIYRFFKNQEKLFLENADYTISLTEKGKREMLTWKHINLKPDLIQVIPCCVDTELFNPENIPETAKIQQKKELDILNDTPIISYLGSIGTWYLLDEMLSFFAVLKKKTPTAKFLFITLDNQENIYSRAKSKGISASDIIIKPADRKTVPIMLSISNWSIFFIKPSYSKISSSPTKQGEIMAMGVPLICNNGVGDTDIIVGNYNSGIVVNNYNYTDALHQMDSFTYHENGIREGALEYFSLNKGVSHYKKIYEQLS